MSNTKWEIVYVLENEKLKNLLYLTKKDDYVFLNVNRDPYVPERLSNKMLTFTRMYNLESCIVYGLRHSFATLCS